MECDPKGIEIILAGVVGIPLRAIMARIKKKLKVTGLLALAVSIGICAAGSAAYLLSPLATWSWYCLLFYTTEVFMVMQIAYRTTHK